MAVGIRDLIQQLSLFLAKRVLIPQRRQIALRHRLDHLDFNRAAHLPPARVEIIINLFLHRLGFAGDEAVINQSRSADEFCVGGNEFAIANDQPIPDGQLREGYVRLGWSADLRIGSAGRLVITEPIRRSAFLPRHRQREKRFVIPVKRQTVIRFLLKQPPAQQEENQSAQRIEITFTPTGEHLVNALQINRRHARRDGHVDV